MVFKTKWEFGDIVYLRVDPEQCEYVITGIVLRPGSFLFRPSDGDKEICVYEFEISKEKDILKSLGKDQNED